MVHVSYAKHFIKEASAEIVKKLINVLNLLVYTVFQFLVHAFDRGVDGIEPNLGFQ